MLSQLVAPLCSTFRTAFDTRLVNAAAELLIIPTRLIMRWRRVSPLCPRAQPGLAQTLRSANPLVFRLVRSDGTLESRPQSLLQAFAEFIVRQHRRRHGRLEDWLHHTSFSPRSALAAVRFSLCRTKRIVLKARCFAPFRTCRLAFRRQGTRDPGARSPTWNINSIPDSHSLGLFRDGEPARISCFRPCPYSHSSLLQCSSPTSSSVPRGSFRRSFARIVSFAVSIFLKDNRHRPGLARARQDFSHFAAAASSFATRSSSRRTLFSIRSFSITRTR